jgi:two-component system CheB/CheR fusion protein
MPATRPSGPDVAARRAARSTPGAPPSVERAESILLHLPVGVVVVNRAYDIQLINSAARRLLGIHGAAIGADLIHQLRGGPLLELRNGIDTAFRGEARTVTVSLDAEETTDGVMVDLELNFYRDTGDSQHSASDTVTIVITDISSHARQRQEHESQIAQLQLELERSTLRLTRMAETNHLLVSANEELTTVNAGLRTSNDELLVANEEVQSTTEEVETLNEELQATNEELETLNEELQATVEELNTTNEDLTSRDAESRATAAALADERARLAAWWDRG